jgi:hypothetical protein
MVSHTRTTMIRWMLVVIPVMLVTGQRTLPAKADSAGTCQSAYGSSPQSPLPDWLMLAEETTDLATINRYVILAAKLLSTGLVDGGVCPGKGLNPDGSANACGLELSANQVTAWQNQFDPQILSSSRSNQLPPKIIKAVIAVESQFWPAADWTLGEVGLGQMTGYGADLVLAWRPAYYQSICRQAFGGKNCSVPYMSQDPSTQYLLRGMVLKEIDATCSNCPGGVDIEKGKQAVLVLAETLNASCLQSARMIYLANKKTPSEILSYADYWRLVLANYQAGAGCVYQALRRTSNPKNWNNIAANFSSGCASGSEYIRRIEEQVKP